MPDSDPEFALFFALLKDRDPDAWCALVASYGPSLRREIAFRRSPLLRGHLDIEDIEQNMWHQFLLALAKVGTSECVIDNSATLRSYLSSIVQHDLHDAHRALLGGQPFTARRCSSLGEAAAKYEWAFVERHASPAELAELYDRLSGRDTWCPQLVHAYQLFCLGYTQQEVRKELGLPLRSMGRVMHGLRVALRAEKRRAG